MTGAGDAGPGVAADVGKAEVGDAAFLALINAHRATSYYSALPDINAVRLAYMGSKTDGMGERWLEHERRKSDAVLAAARPASSPQDGGEALRSSAGLSRQDLLDALASSHEQQVAAERERDEARAGAVTAFAAVCEARGYEARCGDPTGLAHHLIAAGRALADVIAPLRAAALDPPPRGATGPSGTRDGRGSAADGGEGGGGAAHGEG